MKILLVDDHAMFREGIVLLLQRLDSDTVVVECATCEAALSTFESNPHFDIVLLDLSFPKDSGLDWIAGIREKCSAASIVVLSASDDKATVLDAIKRGAMGFIPKSSSSEVLLAALKLVMSHAIYLPSSVFLDLGFDAATPRHGSALEAGHPMTPGDLGLSARQAEVLHGILQGKATKLIARDLGLSQHTVRAHTAAVLRALNVTTRTQAVIVAGRLALRVVPNGEF